MEPLYTSHNTTPAYQLNWGLTLFWHQSPGPDKGWLAELQQATEPAGIRVIKHRFIGEDASQFFVSTRPHVPPSELIRSIKGRLQHLLQRQRPKAFQRNYCLRSIGSATRSEVEHYVASQLGHHRMAEPQLQERLARFQKIYPDVDLSQPSFSSHGEYWHNLHLVIVNEDRFAETREETLWRIQAVIEGAASKHGYRLSRVGLLPDHVHLTLGCPIDCSPESVAMGYLNNCAYACGMKPVYKSGYYVGTIGEYDRGAV
jgi:REP element-mobilizing transposase RayT